METNKALKQEAESTMHKMDRESLSKEILKLSSQRIKTNPMKMVGKQYVLRPWCRKTPTARIQKEAQWDRDGRGGKKVVVREISMCHFQSPKEGICIFISIQWKPLKDFKQGRGHVIYISSRLRSLPNGLSAEEELVVVVSRVLLPLSPLHLQTPQIPAALDPTYLAHCPT